MVTSVDSDTAFRFPVLIGDIGGTNARFALISDAYAEPKIFPILKTAEFETIDQAIQQEVLDKTSVLPKSAMFAVAGPVDGDEIDLTNNHWVVRPHDLAEQFGLGDIVVLNDFAAQALAVVALDTADMLKVGGDEPLEKTSRVILGPGTGLGVAGLIFSLRRWVPLPGEGGHIDIGPRSDRDYEVFPHIEKIGGRVSAEQMLSGRGLLNIYKAICAADGVPAKLEKPSDVSKASIASSNPQAEEAVDLFLTVLGRVAGDLALVFMARGGVFLTGGVTQSLSEVLADSKFRAAFEDKAPHSELLASIPVYAMTDQLAPLAGLAAYARTPALFGDTTAISRWHFGD